MRSRWIFGALCLTFAYAATTLAQSADGCTRLRNFKSPGVGLTSAAALANGNTDANPFSMPGRSAPRPAYCRVEGVMNRRVGVGGEEFGIHFAGPFGPPPTAMEVDVEKRALEAREPLVDSMSRNLTTFSANGGKLIFYHGDSDPWFSPLDTFNYYKNMAAENGGLDAVSKWSQFYFVPGMTHCAGGLSLDRFDLLGALVNWTEKGEVPTWVNATGDAFPGRSRPLCPFPKHAQYRGHGDTEKAENFECR
jgi:hypothetical protein